MKKLWRKFVITLFGHIRYSKYGMSVSNEFLENNPKAKVVSDRIQKLWNEKVKK